MTNLNVPWLCAGKGNSPADGGCIMQIVDWLDSGRWSDRPKCVHPLLRKWAIWANDSLSDEQRGEMLRYTSRLMGTNVWIPAHLLVKLERSEMKIFSRCVTTGSHHLDDGILKTFEELLDTFERISGHKPEPKEIDYSDVCAVMQPA